MPGPRALATLLALMMWSGAALAPRADAAEDVERIYAIAEPNLFYHDVGELQLLITNIGRFGSGQIGDLPSATWRENEYLYLGALWIGAELPDGTHHVSTGGYEIELLPSLDDVDTIYPSFEGDDNGVRFGFEGADDDADGLVDEEYLNGKDDDFDGLIDEDFAAVSQQMLSCEYWDYTPESLEYSPNHVPLDLIVRQRSYAYSDPDFDDFVGFDLEITNDGSTVLNDVYVGLFLDSDIGSRDMTGYWTDDGGFVYRADRAQGEDAIEVCEGQPLPVEMIYMYDVPELAGGMADGDPMGFCGLLLLDHSTDPTGTYFPQTVGIHSAYFISGNDPFENDEDRYAGLSSGVVAGAPTSRADDYRFLVSVGPFERLDPGQSVDFRFAFVLGEGYYDLSTRSPNPELGADGLPSDESLVANAIRARHLYEGQWRDVDGDPDTGVDGKETCLSTLGWDGPLVWEDPCGSGETREVTDLECPGPDAYVDNDCNPCTPNPKDPGCEDGGCESLIHWLPYPGVGGGYDSPAGIGDGSLADAAASDRALRIAVVSKESGRASFSIEADEAGSVRLRVFDVLGRQVADLGTHEVPAGASSWDWDGKNASGSRLGAGVYFARVAGAGEASVQFVIR